MNKVILSQVLTDKGKIIFDGLCDSNGIPVRVEMESDDCGVVLTAFRTRDIIEKDKERICAQHDDCEGCPLNGRCMGESEEEDHE